MFKSLRLLSVLLSCIAVLFINGQAAQAAESPAVDTGKVVAQLISSHDSAAPGENIHIALRTEIDDHWHTYWRNPGDSGEKVNIEWTLPEGLSAGPEGMNIGEIVWPLPDTIATGPIVNYGFEGTPVFPVPFTIPATANTGDVLTIKAHAYYLVCKELCIPEDTPLDIQISVGPSTIDARWNPVITQAINDAPKNAPDVKAGIVKTGETLEISFANLPNGNFDNAFFFTNDRGLILPASPQTLTQGKTGIRLTTDPDYVWESSVKGPLKGVLKFKTLGGEDTGIIVTATVKNTDIIVTATVGEAVDTGTTADNSSPAKKGTGFTLFRKMLSAFIGGLILNLMPCVFPIISIKALSLVSAAHSDRLHARREGWFYTFGVLATFLLLTIILLALRAAGTNLGWGFQLQSPQLVGGLIVLLFLIGLNLLGVFEFSPSGVQNTGSKLTQKGGMTGAFFTGALAIIVATPCMAPFMAGAIGYAFGQPAFVMLAIFMALAIGFALPFLLLAYTPKLLARFPTAGRGMVHFREFLAFPMFAGVIWFVGVLLEQVGFNGTKWIFYAMLAFAFGFWCLKRNHVFWKVLGYLLILVALLSPLKVNADTNSTLGHLETQTWSTENIRAARAEGHPVFVDFTAAWCVNCKINETLVLNTKAVKKIFEETNTTVLIADWTNKNDAIAAELTRLGRAGIPLYLVYPPGNDDVSPVILPQILTKSVIREAIEDAVK